MSVEGRFVTEVPASTEFVLDDIGVERERQFAKWGPQHYPDGTNRAGDRDEADRFRALCDVRAANGTGSWRDILLEETWEALGESEGPKLRKELVQVAAVAAAWVEDIDSRRAWVKAVEAAAAVERDPEDIYRDLGGEG